MKFNYYKKQLDHVLASDPMTNLTIKITSDIRHTNWLAINLESIEEIKTFLDDVKHLLELKGGK